MPLSALVFYLKSKYEHETMRDYYFADMLLYLARAYVKKPKDLPRYGDLISKSRRKHELASQARDDRNVDFTERDIIDMFRGKGKLTQRR
jgi:hypothetical protein